MGEVDKDAQNVNVYTNAILNDLGIDMMTKFYDSIFAENHNLFKFYKPLNQDTIRLVIVTQNDFEDNIIDDLEKILK